MTEDEIEDTIQRFAHAAEVCRDVGFTGIQLHSAHGYLLSSFLSPRVNQRTDKWGGSLENRKRFLGAVYAAVRERVGDDFPIAVKINSADFQRGGFDHDESLEVVRWLGEIGFDLVEISGGSYEDLVLFYGDKDAMGEPVRESTKEREAYFITFADAVRKVTDVPLMVTGGFRSRAAMNAALASGALDVIGLARPMCTQVDAPALLLEDRTERLSELEHSLTRMTSEELGGVGELEVRQANVFADIGFFCLQIVNIGQGRPVNPDMTTMEALTGYLGYETQKAEAWKGPEAVPAA
jgi:2,4-dienoyl-CoA reductase-like NADH-dependent reductase (Old Yellow Enzyme family)